MEHDSNFRNFHVIKGGLQKKAQTASYRLISAWITDTRLMGVCCIKAHWLAEAGDDTFEMFQFFYFDWQEYGLETYESFLGEPDLEMLEAVETVEHSLAAGLGGKKKPYHRTRIALFGSILCGVQCETRHPDAAEIIRV